MLETQKPNTMHWASENDKNFIAELISGKKNKRLIWDGYLPNGKKKQYWENKDIDWEFNQDLSFEKNLNINDKVFHKKFGLGIIINMDSDKAEVKFNSFGIKKVYLRFLEINH